jgi:signal peptidase I
MAEDQNPVTGPAEAGRSSLRTGAQEATAGPDSGQNGGSGATEGQLDASRDRRRAVVEWLVVLVVALVAALLVKTFVVQAFSIPTGSMEPTLEPGDRVLVNKLAYDFHGVHDGDVVVFRRPPRDHSTVDDLIKRVIAGPGQLLHVSNCRVYVDGKREPQPYLPKGWQNPGSEYCTVWDGPGMLDLPNPYRVPAGTYFVMGDNRKDSDDSRFWGPVPASYLVGRAFVRMWPPSRLGFL